MGRKFFDNGGPIPSLEEVLGNLRPLTWAQKVERTWVHAEPRDHEPRSAREPLKRITHLATLFRGSGNRPKKLDVFYALKLWPTTDTPKKAELWLRREWPRLTGLGLREILEYPTRLCIVPFVPSHRWFLSLPLSGAGASVPEPESRPSSPSSETPGPASEPT